MKTRITYIAYDDTEFEYVDDCKEYEQRAVDVFNDIRANWIMSNKEHKLLSMPQTDDVDYLIRQFEDNYNSAWYITVINNLKQDSMKFIWDYYGFEIPEGIGNWYYSWGQLKWIND